ncbi:hypothetical protein BWQ96_04324 [Gracilariopsis chorda]|uniref:Uncharacterized protein n=1 Tax=Gracilariopsis chorda TaxID=448386 RepID=A0A2V3IUX6_9FLOR|nr:hypothetical protein BWQ96_04324 [Gracilariopsis chorda]|eukprot:PXF45889.1 hypothetical protein BWQ96_04324 [Gracilariopsis chorda]
MRGISFSAAARPDKTRPLPNQSAPLATQPPSAASKMMKKLSTTFRRKTNVSPTNILAASTALAARPIVSAPQPSTPPKPAPRAITFSAGSSVDAPVSPTLAEPDIPFFGDREPPRPKSGSNPPLVAAVRGKPAWMRHDNNNAPVVHYPRQMSHQPELPPQQKSAPGDDPYSRHRHFSFDIGQSRPPPAPPAVADKKGAVKPGRRRRPSRRRWLLPLQQSPDTPKLFDPPAGSNYEKIIRHRDRAEAKILVSACTYLESELDRIGSHLKCTRDETCCTCKPVCSENTDANKPGQCSSRALLAAGSERLRAVLRMLEERYDNIEQVYVKSEEYTRAMGKFFQVSPDEFHRILNERDMAKRVDSRKSLR